MADLTLELYAGYFAAAVDAGTAWSGSAALTLTLHGSGYVPNRAADTTVADLAAELPTAGGYTQGGVALVNPSAAMVAANAWAATWQPTTGYLVGQIVRPTTGNGLLYRAATAGTSGAAQPAFPGTAGQCVTDGTVDWVCVGFAALVLSADDLQPAWAGFSAGPFRYLVLSDRAEPVPADQPLIGLYDFGGDTSAGGGDLNITFDPDGGLVAVPIP